MFKNLNNIFKKKKLFLDQNYNKTNEIQNEVEVFLEQEFKDKAKELSFFVSFNSKDKTTIIKTNNKILANELAVRLPDLINFLKSKNILINKILIR